MTHLIIKVVQNGATIVPKFSQCLVDILNKGGKNVLVSYEVENSCLLLSPCSNFNKNCFYINHSQVCPVKLVAESNVDISLPLKDKNDVISVAVCIVLESNDGRILLTKRPDFMRSSPGLWVPPGGHMETGESLLECGLRELREETGLELSADDITVSLLGAWETVYPLLLSWGNPKSHTLVIYYLVRVSFSYIELSKIMKINREEVAAYTWLSSQAFQEISSSEDFTSPTYEIKQYVVSDTNIVETSLNYLQMYNRLIFSGKEWFSGVHFALTSWFMDYKSRSQISKI